MGLHACLAQRVVTRRPGAGNGFCTALDGLIRGNEINKSRARELQVSQGTNVQAYVLPSEESVPGSRGCGEPCGPGAQGLCPLGGTGKGRSWSSSEDAWYSLDPCQFSLIGRITGYSFLFLVLLPRNLCRLSLPTGPAVVSRMGRTSFLLWPQFPVFALP